MKNMPVKYFQFSSPTPSRILKIENLKTIIPYLIFQNFIFALILPTNALAFKGDPCDYSDCSGGYNSGFLVYIFGALLLFWMTHSFFTSSEFRKSVLHAAIWIVMVMIIPMSFIKDDKNAAIIIMIAMFFLHKWIFFDKGNSNENLEKNKSFNSDQSLSKPKAKPSPSPSPGPGPGPGPGHKNIITANSAKSNEKSIRISLISGFIGMRIQREIKGFSDKDTLLWKECLIDTKDNYESTELLYRVARMKFLTKLNSDLILEDSDIDIDNIENKIKFNFCSTQSDAKKLAYSS